MTFKELIENELEQSYKDIYFYALIASRRYKRYEIQKRSGGSRTIHHPAKQLKIYQRFIAENVFSKLSTHSQVFSYKKDTSIKDLALQHKDQKFLLRIDFKDFFPSIRGEYIRSLLKENQNNFDFTITDKDITMINMLVCKNDRLTIGAPSSPIISNVLLYGFDEHIHSTFSPEITYSRYADDLYFSTNVPNKLTSIPEKIKHFLNVYPIKLKVNDEKTIFTSKKHKRLITGLTITTENKISIGRKQKRYIKSLIHKYDNKQITEDQLSYLRGYLSYIKSVDDDFILSLNKKYSTQLMDSLI